MMVVAVVVASVKSPYHFFNSKNISTANIITIALHHSLRMYPQNSHTHPLSLSFFYFALFLSLNLTVSQPI